MLECGKLNPTFILLWNIAKALELSIVDIFSLKVDSSYFLKNQEFSKVLSDIVRESTSEEMTHLLTILKSLQKLKKK